MKCPFCEQETEEGKVVCEYPIWYVPGKDGRFYFNRERRKIAAKSWPYDSVPAEYCKNCKKMILTVDE